MRRVALPCGIAGGVWGLLAPILVLLPFTVRVATPPVTGGVVEEEMVSMVEAGTAGDALPVLSFIALMGVLGLLAIVLSKRSPRLGKPFLWTSAVAMLAASLLGIFSIGLFFLPASVLLLVAAIGLKRESKRGEASNIMGSLRGTSSLLRKFSPSPCQGEGDKGDGVNKIYEQTYCGYYWQTECG